SQTYSPLTLPSPSRGEGTEEVQEIPEPQIVMVGEKGSLAEFDQVLRTLETHPENVGAINKLHEIGVHFSKQEKDSVLTPSERREAVRLAETALKANRFKSVELNSQLEQIGKQIYSSDSSQANLLSVSLAVSKLSQGGGMETETLRMRISNYYQELRQKLQRSLLSGSFSNPKDEFVARGFVWFFQNDYAQALEYWSKGLALDPSDAALRELAAWVDGTLRQKQKRERTARLLKNAERFYLMGGGYEDTVAQLRSIWDSRPEEPQVQVELQEVEKKIRKFEIHRRISEAKTIPFSRPLDATQAWLAVVNLDPANGDAKQALENIRSGLLRTNLSSPRLSRAPRKSRRHRRPDQPLADVSRGIPSQNDVQKCQEHYVVGRILNSQGQLADAAAEMREAVKLCPHWGEADMALKRLQAETGMR
ncbi:MAG: hypothetical protein HY399_07695, partial [Elusimicrobia bacterium]|nr:hypothetical protein [Elusimicrobiota bacterium]